MLAALLVVAGAYLLGSVSFAVVVSRAFGLPDPHEYGSGNPGATNVLRTGNKLAAVLTLAGDGVKGWLAVVLAQWCVHGLGVPDWAIPGAALAVFVGHLFPVFHGFKGGKGVATAAGIVFALHWPLGLALMVVWATDGVRIQDLVARGAHGGRAAAVGRLLRVRQRADRVGHGADLRAAVLAAPCEHPAVARRQGAHDRALERGAAGAAFATVRGGMDERWRGRRRHAAPHARTASRAQGESMATMTEGGALKAQAENLAGSEFRDVNLASSRFDDVNLRGAVFTNVALSGATIRDACLADVSIAGAGYEGMRIEGILVTELLRVYRERSGAAG